jgi:hypothetical protein
MPADRTIVTELATALGTLPHHDLASALISRPSEVRISSATWDRLDALYAGGGYAQDFAIAYTNGRAFASAPDALAGRSPRIVEWTGGRRPPGDEVAPIDLRIDHVYMVSCKYLSANISNPSPARLFDGLLATAGEWDSTDWYQVVAPAEYQALYEATVRSAGVAGLPKAAQGLSTKDRAHLRAEIASADPDEAVERAYANLCASVAEASANRWRANLAGFRLDLMLWRLLRIGNAPYFLLGAHGSQTLRLRVATAWDWRDTFELRDLSVEGVPAGQPKVEWVARYRMRNSSRESRSVRGHVEIRWSHGRFAHPPEAKVYLDTPIEQVPGYHPLGGDPATLFSP